MQDVNSLGKLRYVQNARRSTIVAYAYLPYALSDRLDRLPVVRIIAALYFIELKTDCSSGVGGKTSNDFQGIPEKSYRFHELYYISIDIDWRIRAISNGAPNKKRAAEAARIVRVARRG